MSSLISFIHNNAARFGRLDGERVTDLTDSFAGRFASLSDAANAGALAELYAADGASLALGDVTLTAPLPSPGKIICVGVNFPDRNAEYKDGQGAPANPSLFIRFPGSFVGHGDDLRRPPESEQLDYEGEIAIVIGSGISGGWAAKELTEKGLKTLVLERGRMVKHVDDYTTAHMDPWDFPNGGQPTREEKARQFKQARTGYTVNKAHSHFFVDDIDHPYNEVKRFDWMRGYHVGGRSIMWGRQSYRLSDIDFEANLKDGVAVDWPIRYRDLKPWYDHVEQYIGVSGENLGLKQLPDGKFLKPMELNCVENHLKENISKNYNDRVLTIGRTAHITEGTKEGLGRVNCQFRNRCMRGCPYGAYFSSLSSTLPAADKTGNMTLIPNSIVHEITYDPETQLATGVKVIDSETGESYEYKAKVIFLCASAIASASIMMQSKSDRFPNGLGNDSGELGHNVICLDNLFTGRKENISNLIKNPNFEFINHDITVPYFRNGIDEIYNLACPASPIHYQKNPIKTVKTCTIGVINMLGLAKSNGARILQASTSEVYGDPEVHPQKEEYRGNVNPIGPRACYDEGKRCAETLFFDYHRQNNVDIRVIRIFNTYGPRMMPNDGRVVSNFILELPSQSPNSFDVSAIVRGSLGQNVNLKFHNVCILLSCLICQNMH